MRSTSSSPHQNPFLIHRVFHFVCAFGCPLSCPSSRCVAFVCQSMGNVGSKSKEGPASPSPASDTLRAKRTKRDERTRREGGNLCGCAATNQNVQDKVTPSWQSSVAGGISRSFAVRVVSKPEYVFKQVRKTQYLESTTFFAVLCLLVFHSHVCHEHQGLGSFG